MKSSDTNDLIQYRITRAKETLQEVDAMVENEFWNAAVNRLYYSCYYAVSALLLKNEIKSQTHSGTRQMLGLHFIQTEKLNRNLGKFYSDLFEKRQTGDYDDFIEYDKETLNYLIPLANELIKEVENFYFSS